MKKFILIIFVVMTCKFYSCESAELIFEAEECDKTQMFDYNDIIHFDYMILNSDVYMIGDTGTIIPIVDSDNCELFKLSSFTTKDLNAIDGSTELSCIIVGDSGVIIRDLYDLSESGTIQNLNDVTRGWDVGSYVAVGDSGTILRSTDEGYSWDKIPVANTDTLVQIEKGSTEGSLTALGKSGYFLTSVDDGLTWNVRMILYEGLASGQPDLNSINFINETTGWAAGGDGIILKTFNGGIFWFRQFTNTNETFNFIKFNTYLNGYALGNNGTVLFSTSGGTQWLPHPGFDTLTTKNLQRFIKKDSMTYLAIGDSGLLMNIKTGFNTDPLSGIYTIGPTGDFADLTTSSKAADYFGINDDVVFEIENGIYNEQLVINDIYGSSADKTITYRSASGNPSDVILEFASTGAVNNFTVLFNNTRNILFENVSVNALDTGFARAVELRGVCSNIHFKNVIFNGKPSTGNSLNKAVVINSNFSTTNLNDIRFEDCEFNNGTYGLRIISPNTSTYFNNIEVINNSFGGQSNASISFSYIENFNMRSNQLNNTPTGIILSNCRNFSLNKNTVSSNSFAIDLTGCTSNNGSNNFVSNNFIRSSLSGIRMSASNNNNSFVYNTILIKDLLDTNAVISSTAFSTVSLNGLNNYVNNNLLINSRRGFVFSGGQGNSYSSINYNNYFTSGNILAQWNGSTYPNLTAFKNASGRDTNSVSAQTEFISDTDLHLIGVSSGDTTLIGIPITNVTDDIDFDTRDPQYPYMGADEIPSAPLPVELSTFTGNVNKRDVILNWVTSGETNNHGFEVERTNSQSNFIKWQKTGFISGAGTTSEILNYSFTDKGLSSGKYKYRLKQIDLNGNFKFYNLVSEIEIGIPTEFNLSQNYPNPFNPSTKITYDLPIDGNVSLKIYDMIGREVATLVNGFEKAGYYTVTFNKTGAIASGVYFYRLQIGLYTSTKRMVLLK